MHVQVAQGRRRLQEVWTGIFGTNTALLLPYAVVIAGHSRISDLLFLCCLHVQVASGARRPLQEGWTGIFRHEYSWMLALALGLPVLQQACGINTVILFSSVVCVLVGVSLRWGGGRVRDF